MKAPTSTEVGRMLLRVESESEMKRSPWPRIKCYVRATVCEAERLPNGNWKVTGHGWLRDGVEFTDENFRENFQQL
jgi:hypothetical protein